MSDTDSQDESIGEFIIPYIKKSNIADSALEASLSRFDKLFNRLTISSDDDKKAKYGSLLTTFDLQGVADYIKNRNVKNIIVMTGAGISTSAGVPDFRSPGTGLYEKLGGLHLPHPTAVFDLSYFRKHPQPFYKIAKDLFPLDLKPTLCHYFIRLLDEKGMLLRWYTQNIDSLEFVTGINPEKLVTAHGCHHTSTCLGCGKKYDLEWIVKKVFVENCEVACCDLCSGYVKPDIVFFGENLPGRFFELSEEDFPKCDLLLIMGTSLVVHPFAGLVDTVNDDVPRLLINLTEAGQSDFWGFHHGSGLQYNFKDNYRDVFYKGTCDDGAEKLAECLGYRIELDALVKKEWEKIDRRNAEKGVKQVDKMMKPPPSP